MIRAKLLLHLGLIILVSAVSAQDAHYWRHQFGPTSTFLGGAVTGGVRDNSNIFYNPGAAAFTSNFNLSLQTDAIYNENLYIRNGGGEGINMHFNTLETYPQIFAVTYSLKKESKWRTSIGVVSPTYSNIRLRASNEAVAEIFPNLPGNEIYTGSWNYRNRLREDWFGLGISRIIGKKFGLGGTAFATFRSYEFIETQEQNLFRFSAFNQNFVPLRYVTRKDNFDGTAAGILFKLGLAYEWKEYKLGLTITTPRAQLDFLGNMFYSSSQFSNLSILDSLVETNDYSIQYEKAVSTYKSPWIIDFGIMKNFFETDIYFRIAYYGKVDRYEMIKPKQQSEINQILYGTVEGAGVIHMAQKEVVNVALGWNRLITKKFGLMAGIRTDFNNIDWDALNEHDGLVPAFSTWNLYHFSAGTRVSVLKHNFTVGLTYTLGRSNNHPEFVDLSTPTSTEIFTPVENIADVYYDQLNITIGYVYNFNTIKPASDNHSDVR